jgi:hypothetical protein
MAPTRVLAVGHFFGQVACQRLIEMQTRPVVIYTCMARVMVARLTLAPVGLLLDNDFVPL